MRRSVHCTVRLMKRCEATSMAVCVRALSAESRPSMAAHRSRNFEESRTTVKARAISEAGAPVRWLTSRTKVGPQRLTSEFTTCSVAISRRSR